MLKLAIIAIAAVLASQQLMVESAITFVRSDPFLYSARKGLETCSSSGSVLSSSQISIESVFSDSKDGSKSPAGLKITFNRLLKKGLSAQDVRQEYTFPSTGTGSLAAKSDSVARGTPGWLMVIHISVISVAFVDFESGVVIVVTQISISVDIYVFSSRTFLESSSGLLVDGCPNKEVLPWDAETKFSLRPRLRKRQSSDCLKMAEQYAELFPGSDTFSYENVLKMCESNSNTAGSFSKNTPNDVQRETLEALRIGNELYNKYFSGEKISAQEFKEI